MTGDDFFGEEVVVAHVITNGAHREAVVTVTFDLGTVGEVNVNGVILMNIVAGVMEMRIGNDDDGGFGEGFDTFGDFGGDDGDVKRGAAFFLFETAETFGVNDIVVIKKFASRNHAGENTVELSIGVEIASFGQNVVSVADGIGDALEAFSVFLMGAVGSLEGADEFLIFGLEMKRTDFLPVAVEGVFARR